MAHVIYSMADQEYGQDSLAQFEEYVVDKTVRVKFLRKDMGLNIVEVYLNNSLKEGESEWNNCVNFKMVKSGFMILDESSSLQDDENWSDAVEAGYQANPELIGIINNQVDY